MGDVPHGNAGQLLDDQWPIAAEKEENMNKRNVRFVQIVTGTKPNEHGNR